MSGMKPLCFVLMPFGVKQYGSITFDFDEIYTKLIKVAIEEAGLEPIRADEEQVDGIIHKPMFERLVLCEYAVADLTGANANVFYELGVRHGSKPQTTVLIFADSTRLPFDVSLLRAMPYSIDGKGNLSDLAKDIEILKQKLLKAKEDQAQDSPIFQLLENYPDINHSKTDVFQKQVAYSKELKERLFEIRSMNENNRVKFNNLSGFESELGDLLNVEAGVLIDLMLSYRSLGTGESLENLVKLVDKMPLPVRNTVLVQEQLGFSLNRLGKDELSENVLLELIKERGGSSETYGILGRVYKDRWLREKKDGKAIKAKGALKRAIETYLNGFESDQRDAYPGVNAVTLMTIQNPENPKIEEILPVVRYAVLRKMELKFADYWDHATLFELDVLAEKYESAEEHLENALSINDLEVWMPETTLNNLRLIVEAMQDFGKDTESIKPFEEALEQTIDEYK